MQGWETEGSDSWSVSHDLEETLLNNLRADHYTKYYDLAEMLDLISREVLQACRQFAKRGLLESGKREQANEFRRIS